jgi:FkbM family methyltransferase
MTMISYAQNHEDVLLRRLFAPDFTGFYIDVGANDPVGCSVTKHFYDRGWSGINVEPGRIFERLREARRRDVNLNVALSDRPERALFYEYPSRPGDSTLSPEVAEANSRFRAPRVVREVEVTTLAEVCAAHVGPRPVDFLSIDVEGHEARVIAGADWRRWRPRVVLVEATRPHTPQEADLEWEPALLSHGYRFGLFDGLNRFYVRQEDADLLRLLKSPVCVFDDYVPYHHLLALHRAGVPTVPKLVESPAGVPGLGQPLLRLTRNFEARFPRLAGYLKPVVRAAFRRGA